MKLLLSTLAAASMSAAVASWTAAAQGYDYVVEIDSLYHPDHLAIKIGDTVIWKNFDAIPHTVTTEPGPTSKQEYGKFDSGEIPSGSEFRYTFLRTGTYRYYCRIHPDIMGTVVVTQ
ncbi:MAG TPA: plastocyanin/azurin family copper-binding protein [Planctomycetota bacterium]|nr:plastocyanin/azurin family copper-binding protein [Planctomycetota bacterium]